MNYIIGYKYICCFYLLIVIVFHFLPFLIWKIKPSENPKLYRQFRKVIIWLKFRQINVFHSDLGPAFGLAFGRRRKTQTNTCVGGYIRSERLGWLLLLYYTYCFFCPQAPYLELRVKENRPCWLLFAGIFLSIRMFKEVWMVFTSH